MAQLFSLVLGVEDAFYIYLQGNYSGAYPLFKGFSTAQVSSPCIIVEAGKFIQIEPGMNVYRGNLTVSIWTQADDAVNAVSAHDSTLNLMDGLLNNQAALNEGINGGATFNLWDARIESQENKRTDRDFVGVFELVVDCQSLAIPPL